MISSYLFTLTQIYCNIIITNYNLFYIEFNMTISEIRNKLIKAVFDTNANCAQIAQMIGISEPTLNNFINFVERKPHKKSLDKIVLWLEKYEGKQ